MIQTLNSAVRHIPAWPIYILTVAPLAYWIWQAQIGALGAEPIKTLEHKLGELALQMLVVGLAITPLRRFLGLNLIKFRRAIGVTAFTLVAWHLLVWLILDVQILSQIWADILKRPYITVGMASFLILVPLVMTSNNLSIRKLGPTWRKLHKATYAAVLLGAVHFIMVAKGFQWEPIIYLLIIATLVGLRFVPKKS